jgi:plastocyanin
VFERWCEPAPRAGDALGTEDAPVNEIALVHEVSVRPGHPNMWFDVTRITASSSEPVVFTFENRNPEPYLFNIAIYEGTPESLEGLEPIAQTVADTGAFTQTLEVELEPGTYTYADNVHAYSMRGTLVVV